MAEPTHTDKRFQHIPLEGRAQGRTRRVRIRPSQDIQSPIHLELQFVNINERRTEWDMEGETPGNRFIALSYTWGDEKPEHQVYIEHNDEHGWFSIRQNLFDFLTTRRDTQTLSPWFWIDQICIDQANMAEKGHQVNQMYLIYTKAKKVEIWLGPAFEGSEGLMRLIRDHPGPRMKISKKDMKPYIPALRQLADMPYWSRVWIVQEVKLPSISEVEIRVGQQTFPWTKLMEAFGPFWGSSEGLCFTDYLSRESSDRFRPLMSDAAFMEWPWNTAWDLVNDRECAHIHDKVFGVLSLVPELQRFYPDYSMTKEELLFKILSKQHQQNLRYLWIGERSFNMIPTAREWLQILDGSHTEIETAPVRKWLLREVHIPARKRRKCDPPDWSGCVDAYERLFFPLGVGPDLLFRVRLRWKIPNKGSLRWRSQWLRMGLHHRGPPMHFLLMGSQAPKISDEARGTTIGPANTSAVGIQR